MEFFFALAKLQTSSKMLGVNITKSVFFSSSLYLDDEKLLSF